MEYRLLTKQTHNCCDEGYYDHRGDSSHAHYLMMLPLQYQLLTIYERYGLEPQINPKIYEKVKGLEFVVQHCLGKDETIGVRDTLFDVQAQFDSVATSYKKWHGKRKLEKSDAIRLLFLYWTMYRSQWYGRPLVCKGGNIAGRKLNTLYFKDEDGKRFPMRNLPELLPGKGTRGPNSITELAACMFLPTFDPELMDEEASQEMLHASALLRQDGWVIEIDPHHNMGKNKPTKKQKKAVKAAPSSPTSPRTQPSPDAQVTAGPLKTDKFKRRGKM